MILITLPWACLVSDNAKYGVYHGRKLLTTQYRNALAAAQLHVRRQVPPGAMLTGPVHVQVTFHEPDRSRVRDLWNYGKLIGDCLKGLAIEDDGQIDDSRLVRGAVREDDACVVVRITPLGRMEAA